MAMRLKRSFSVATLAAGFALAAPILVNAAEESLVEGKFIGQSGHNTTGTVTIAKSGSKMKAILERDFRFDGAPDPQVGFGNNGTYDPSTQLSSLKSKSGRQVYRIPGSFDPQEYNQIYIWCERFKVPLGVAGLSWPEEEDGEKEADTQ